SGVAVMSCGAALPDGGKRMPGKTIMKVVDPSGAVIWPDPAVKPATGTQVVSPQTAYIITDILEGNTEPKTNPFWGDWAIYDKGVRRPAAYKTGTTNDNRDVHAYGYLAPPKDPKAPGLIVGVWMGNSETSPDKEPLSRGSSAPLWSRILTDVSSGLPIADFKQPKGHVTAQV